MTTTPDTDREKPDRCDCCQSEVAEIKYYQPSSHLLRPDREAPPSWFCDLCATTMASNSVVYSDQYRGQTETLQTICYVGNEILHMLRMIDANNAIDAENAEYQRLGLITQKPRIKL